MSSVWQSRSSPRWCLYNLPLAVRVSSSNTFYFPDTLVLGHREETIEETGGEVA